MMKPLALGTALLLALTLPAPTMPAFAEDEKGRPPLAFDEVNTPLADVVAKATAAKKPIFIDFFLDG